MTRSLQPPVLITGGCGFIGCNLADALAAGGERILILDNLSRPGVKQNAEWLVARHGAAVEIAVGDVRNAATVRDAARRARAVLHLAAQVAVTTSLENPVEDFSINAMGTLNVLEALRCGNPGAPLIFASTNKVYGRLLDDGAIARHGRRYLPKSAVLDDGVGEDAPLDLYSPYGCSKGTADQYVHDYGRVFGLRTVVLRMSCIYGPRQFGTEDQGWIAHFLLRAMRGEPITIYGDGYQVRDALYITDAVAGWCAALARIEVVAGRVFNIGGGPSNIVSLRELLDRIADLHGEHPDVSYAAARPGDQPWYVSNITQAQNALGWSPQVSLDDGLQALDRWLASMTAPPRAANVLGEARA